MKHEIYTTDSWAPANEFDGMLEVYSIPLDRVLAMRPSDDYSMVDPKLVHSILQFTDAADDKRHLGGWGEQFPRLRNPHTVAYEFNGRAQIGVLDVKSLKTVLRA